MIKIVCHEIEMLSPYVFIIVVQVDELLAAGVNITIYSGQVSHIISLQNI